MPHTFGTIGGGHRAGMVVNCWKQTMFQRRHTPGDVEITCDLCQLSGHVLA